MNLRSATQQKRRTNSDAKYYLENTSKSQDEATTSTDEEDSSDVQEEGNGGVGDQDDRADAVQLLERRPTLSEGENEKVDDSADLFGVGFPVNVLRRRSKRLCRVPERSSEGKQVGPSSCREARPES